MDPRPKFKYNPKLKLKPPPLRLPPKDPGCRSDEIHPSPGGAQPNSDIRDFYLYHVYRREGEDVNAEAFVPPPLISASPFVPVTLIRLLMRGKKDSALGVKYGYGDRITDSKCSLCNILGPKCEVIVSVIPRCFELEKSFYFD